MGRAGLLSEQNDKPGFVDQSSVLANNKFLYPVSWSRSRTATEYEANTVFRFLRSVMWRRQVCVLLMRCRLHK